MQKSTSLCLLVLFCIMLHLIVTSPGECANPPERYAVVLTAGEGCTDKLHYECPTEKGDDPLGTIEGFWSDALIVHDMLVYKCCYPEENVYVFFRNGSPLSNTCPDYNLIPDWRVYPAIKDTVARVFGTLAERMDENDLLFIYAESHGCCYNPMAEGSLFGLVGYDWTDELKDTELKALVDSIHCRDKIIFMASCFAGGFVDELNRQNQVIVTCNDYRACRVADDMSYPSPECQAGGDGGDPCENETCAGVKWYRPEFTYHVLNAFRGKTVYYDNPIDADYNDDGWTSAYEAYAFECSTDSWGGCGDNDERCWLKGDLHTAQIGSVAEAYAESVTLFGRIDLASGTLCRDTTYWSGTLTVTGDVVVPEGKTLIIRPGTLVQCDSLDDRAGGQDTNKVEIIVYGTLMAEGTQGDPIKITSCLDPIPGQWGGYASDIWRGIRFEPASAGTLSYLTVRRAYYAVDCDSASPVVEHASICDNQMAGIRCIGNSAPRIACGDSIASGYRGIVCKGSSQPVIQEGVVVDSCNVGIEVRGSSTPVIRDCRVKRCQKGITVAADANPVIGSGCDIFNNWQIGLNLKGNGSCTVSVDSIKVRDNYSYGVRCDNAAKVTISHTEVYGNDDGVAAFDYTECLLGRASPEEAGYNNLYNNSDCNVWNATTSGDTLFAENCWWGETPPDTSKICGLVDYDPYLGSQVQLVLPMVRGSWYADDEALVSFGPVISNPVGERVTLSYLVRRPGSRVKISIYNTLGQKVKTLVNAWKAPGQYQVAWDRTSTSGSYVEPGVYFSLLEAGHSTPQTRKLVVVGSGHRR